MEDGGPRPDAGGGAPAAGDDARRARHALLLAHGLGTWGQRAMEFGLALLLLEAGSSRSLAVVAAFGLLDSAVVAAGAPAAGRFVDAAPRLEAATTMIAAQNVAVAASAGACLALLRLPALAAAPRAVLLAAALGAGAASSLGATGATLSVEREWTAALAAGDGDALARLNAQMRRVDLGCLILSPIAVSLLLERSAPAAAAAIAAWHLAAWWPQRWLLRRAQARAAALRAPRAGARAAAGAAAGGGAPPALAAAGLYFRQPAWPSALSLALLYLTVMSFGNLMTAYCKLQGLRESSLAVYRGAGALAGLAATVAWPAARRALGPRAAGAAAVWAQAACLAAAVAPTLLRGGGAASAHALAALLAASRFGLWGFDLAASQILQETTHPAALGAVSGVQSSLQSGFQMLAFAAGVAAPRPESFPVLMVGSCAVVAAAAALFTAWAARASFGGPRAGAGGEQFQPVPLEEEEPPLSP